MKKYVRLMLLGCVLKAGILSADTNVWPMFRYDARHTGQSPYTGPECCDLKWKYEGAINFYYSSPAVRIVGGDTVIYVGNRDKCVYGIKDYGSSYGGGWAFPTADEVWASPAISSTGLIYVPDKDVNFYSIKSAGSQNWKYTAPCKFGISSPVISSDGTIYVGSGSRFSNDSLLYAINPDGSLKWTFEVGTSMRSSPAIGSDGTIYIGSDDKKLYAIEDLGTFGNCKWSYLTGGQVRSSPAIGSDGTIYFSTLDNEMLYALNSNGTLKWTYPLPGDKGQVDGTGIDLISSPAIASDGTIYIGAVCTDTVHAVNPDGTRKWATCIPSFDGVPQWNITSSPALSSNNTLYIGVGDIAMLPGTGGLVVMNQLHGNILCTYSTENEVWDSPAIGPNNTVYFGDCSGHILYAIRCSPTGVEEKRIDGIRILDNHPNPFTGETFIEYEIGKSSHVSIKVYDLCGRLLNVLIDEIQLAGIYKVKWDGTDKMGKLLPRGIYYYITQCDEKSVTRKVVLL